MALEQGCVVDAAELPTSALANQAGPLSGLKWEAMLRHAQASLERLIILVSFI